MSMANTASFACETLLSRCATGAAMLDAAGAFVFVNEAWESLWGVSRDRMIGWPAFQLHHDFHAMLVGLSEAKSPASQHVSVEMRFDADGPRWLKVSLSRACEEGGARYLAIATDTTEHAQLRRQIRMVTLMAEESRRMSLVTDADGRLTYVNRAFCAAFGFDRDQSIGRSLLDLLAGPCTDLRRCARMRRRVRAEGAARGEALLYDRSGEEIWVEASARAARNAAGQPISYVIMLEDIGEARKLRSMQQVVLDAIAKDEPLAEIGDILCRTIAAMAPNVTPSLLRIDSEGRVRPVASPGLPPEFSAELEGVPISPDMGSCGAAAYLGRSVLSRDIATDPDWAPYRELPLAVGLRACWSSPILGKDNRKLGAFAFYFRETRGPSRWHKKIVSAALDLCALAIDRHDAQAEIERLAYFDALTGLPNRLKLRESFSAMTAASNGAQQAAFLFIDVDNFKDVNDTLGHTVGDELLVAISVVLKELVGPDDVLARQGGDEFVVVLPGADANDAGAFAERVKAALSTPLRLGETFTPVTLSIGVSIYPDHGRDAETLLTNADSAMYAAKRSGRSTHRLYDPAMRRAAEERVAVSRALRDALANDRLCLHYQPQVWTGNGILRGVEALARWTDPALGDVPPAKFIPIAEEYGLIGEIGEWCLREAVRQLASWRAAGLAVPKVSVNLSPAQLQSRGLVGTIAQAIADFGVRPGELTLEITEGALMKDRATAIEIAKAIHSLGVRMSLDDFGTGYSNLARLAQLPIDELKIDRSFMSRIADDLDARAVVDIAVQIGKTLRMTVVAEGVETREQKRVLQELGCDVLQGYLYARPMPAGRLADWLLASQVQAVSESAA
jgi:diguanylate cyclase (GGDEF)-like protein/PAS domain S-box-containing protein